MASNSSAPGAGELHIILFGLSGSGVSSTGNSIIGKHEFEVGQSFDSITKECKRVTSFRLGRKIEVIDTPGFPNDLDETQTHAIFTGLKQGLEMMSTGPNVFLLVSSVDRFTEDSKVMVRCLKKVPGIQNHIIIIFTGCERFVGSEEEIKQKVVSSDSLKELMELSSNRFILFSNTTYDEKPIEELFRIADTLIVENKFAVLDKRIFSDTVEASVISPLNNRENFSTFDVLKNFVEEWGFTRPKRAYRRNCTIL